MSSLSQNLSELSNFCESRLDEISISQNFCNLEILLNFFDFCPIFCMWAPVLNIFNLCIATWGLKQLLPWFPRGGIRYPPPLACDEIDTPWEIGLTENPRWSHVWQNNPSQKVFKASMFYKHKFCLGVSGKRKEMWEPLTHINVGFQINLMVSRACLIHTNWDPIMKE